MAFNGKKQLTKDGKCTGCGADVQWKREETGPRRGRWSLFAILADGSTAAHLRPEGGRVCDGATAGEASKPEPEPATKPEPETAEPATADSALVNALAARVRDLEEHDVLSRHRIAELERERREGVTVTVACSPVLTDAKPVRVTGHKQMPELMAALAADQPALLHGEPGGGKSEAFRVAARALEIPSVEIILGPADTPSRILGYVNPVNDTYQASEFVTGWRDGALVLIDEVCIANPAVLTVLNGALGGADTVLSTPGGPIKRHPRTRLVCADNTDGMLNPEYPTRRALDLSFRSRLVPIEWAEDQALTLAVVKSMLRERAELAPSLVAGYRARAAVRQVPRRITLRTLYAAARLMAVTDWDVTSALDRVCR